MELDQRKLIILKSIVRTYLETGEPVGSRTISKLEGLGVSPATIRNEMADLEEMGLIVQPHTSAGRIPTDKGYRLYVDELMDEQSREILDMQEFMNRRMDRVENILKRMAKMLAANTQYTTMISGPRYTKNEVKLIQLSHLDAGHIVAVVVVEGNEIRNRIIPTDVNVTNEDLLRLNILLNSALQGKSLDDITLSLVHQLKAQSGDYSEVVGSVLEAVADVITESCGEQPELYTSGATNIFRYPELSESDNARDLLTTLEEKEELLDFFSEREQTGSGIRVYIGNESPIQAMQNCSVVTANYELGKGLRGTIGIIGPKRMDYEHVVGTLKTLMERLDDIYRNE